ncbi:MAG TPA: hypothetical protein VLA13_06525 [Massilibacterium sp.]|nr:hypothetical protein [Massilibacterium sp.]
MLTPTTAEEVDAYTRQQTDDIAEDASRLKTGIIDVNQVPLRTSITGARIEWDGINGLVQYDADGNPVSWLDLEGNAHFENGYFKGEIHAESGTFTSRGIYDGEQTEVKIDKVIQIEDNWYKQTMFTTGTSILRKDDGIWFHRIEGSITANHSDGSSIAGITVTPEGYISIDANEGYNWLDINVDSTTVRGEAEFVEGIIPIIRAPLSLQNGWEYYPGFGQPMYTKKADGFVKLEGGIQNGLSGNYACARLPVGCRPAETVILNVESNGQIGRIDVTPDGYVWTRRIPNSWFSLSSSESFYVGN